MKRHQLVNPLCIYLLFTITLSACLVNHNTGCVDCSVITASPNNHPADTHKQPPNYICDNASSYNGKVVGDGHCVSLIKRCSGAPNTDQWRPGQTVWMNNIESGTIIATFEHGRYPNKTGYHAAVYIEQDIDGIWVWDQWQGKAVHKRLIRWRNDGAKAANSAQAYQTVTRLN